MPMTKLALGPILRALRLGGDRRPYTMSRAALAEASGLTVEAIRAIETGRRLNPTWGTVQALATALGVSTEELRTDREGWV